MKILLLEYLVVHTYKKGNNSTTFHSATLYSLPRRQAVITILPGHVIITGVSGSGNETTVTLYIGLPLSAIPLDPNNPIISGSVAIVVVQTAETAIESALGLQVCVWVVEK